MCRFIYNIPGKEIVHEFFREGNEFFQILMGEQYLKMQTATFLNYTFGQNCEKSSFSDLKELNQFLWAGNPFLYYINNNI